MQNKQFIIKYDPSYSLGKMFNHLDQAIEGKKHLQPENVIVCHDLATIYSTITKNRLDLLTFLVSKQPENIYQLAKLLKRSYSHVWTDCQTLNGLGIIELKKSDNDEEKIRPIALYEEIIFNFPVKQIVESNSRILLKNSSFVN
jgi:predicted transcriptional regulator